MSLDTGQRRQTLFRIWASSIRLPSNVERLRGGLAAKFDLCIGTDDVVANCGDNTARLLIAEQAVNRTEINTPRRRYLSASASRRWFIVEKLWSAVC